jgi:hypothetical protein
MKLGESIRTNVSAYKYWNDTKIDLVIGEEYNFVAEGEWID